METQTAAVRRAHTQSLRKAKKDEKTWHLLLCCHRITRTDTIYISEDHHVGVGHTKFNWHLLCMRHRLNVWTLLGTHRSIVSDQSVSTSAPFVSAGKLVPLADRV